MEIFDVFSMNRIENYAAAGEHFWKMLFLRSHRHFSNYFYPKEGGGQCPLWIRQGGHTFFKGGGGL